jgi:hypothetical protein
MSFSPMSLTLNSAASGPVPLAVAAGHSSMPVPNDRPTHRTLKAA